VAGVRVKFDFKTEPIRRWLKRAATRGASSELWADIGEELVQAVQKNFDEQSAAGDPWAPLTAQYRAARAAGNILTVSSRLRNSITYHPSRDSVLIGTTVVYGAIHQFGGKTKPHTIRPRRKKALFWPGARHPVKLVNHPGSEIPARPYLVWSDDDWERVSRIIKEHLLGR
jgi:phage virion morphogenesis protein